MSLEEMSLPKSTYCSDPAATHIVNAMGDKIGAGIYGYYTNEFDAHRVCRYLKKNGARVATVEPYDCNDEMPSIHPLIEASWAGH